MTLGEAIARVRKRVPPRVQPYAVAVLGTVVITIPLVLLYHTPPPRNPIIGALLTACLLIFLLGTAWRDTGRVFSPAS